MSTTGHTTDELTRVIALATQFSSDLIGVTGDETLLSWKVSSERISPKQLGFQIQSSALNDFSKVSFDSGAQTGDSQLSIPAGDGARSSREVRYYRVRIKTNFGWTQWSPIASIETGLLKTSDWQAVFIGDDSLKESPSPILRKSFSLRSKPASARLYVSSMGLNETFINGQRVSDGYLNPGWTVYQERLLTDCFDVTNLLSEGSNVIGAELSDGWWRGRFGFMNMSDHYGTEIGLISQLEVTYEDGSVETVVSDDSWKASTAETRFSSIYDGSTIDFNYSQTGWKLPGFDDSSWACVGVKTQSISVLKPRITSPVRAIHEFPMAQVQKEDRVLLKGVQNVSGWVRLVVDGKKGQEVVIRHAEMLEPGERLHTKALRSAKATDRYVLAEDGRHVLEPRFTFHGFQHADVQTDATVVSATAVAISSDNSRRSHFSSSDTRINRLHENVVWSQLDNFVSLPTDCPQRDERLGWTGDAQAFANTSNTLFNTASFWKSWLIDVELDQHENGDVGAVVPDLLKLASEVKIGDWILEGRAGWADAATIVPVSVYEYFGDKSVLQKQLNSMRRWTNALDARRKGQKFLPTEFQFGDWCDPDAPGDRPWESKVSADFVANAFFAHTADLMAYTETLVGTAELARHYGAMAAELKRDIWDHFGNEVLTTTAGCSIAIEFGIVPLAEKQNVADRLAEMVAADKGMITTGFLATPLILHALSKNGHSSEAYQMLMRREFRSWLYAVDKGATTMWERWDAIQADGSIHSGAMDTNPEGQDDASMISFNHYAYGAVVDWIYRNIGGLAPTLDAPGYQRVVVAPKPAIGFTFAKTSIETGFGQIDFNWNLAADGALFCNLVVPFGVTAQIDLPGKEGARITCNGDLVQNGAILGTGTYRLVVDEAELISY